MKFAYVGCANGCYINGKIGEKPKFKRPTPPKGQNVSNDKNLNGGI